MGQLHRLVNQGSREQAKALRTNPEQRTLIVIAAAVLGEEGQRPGISYSGFALTALPHHCLFNDQPWERHGHRIRLLIRSGRLPVHDNGFNLYNVP